MQPVLVFMMVAGAMSLSEPALAQDGKCFALHSIAPIKRVHVCVGLQFKAK